jgi:hypothetical protein
MILPKKTDELTNLSLKKDTSPDKTKFICKKCGLKIFTLYEFLDRKKVWVVEPEHMKIVCGAHPKTGESVEKKFILCKCFWENFSEKLLKIKPEGNLHELENSEYEEERGFFITTKTTTTTCFNPIFRWQIKRESFFKILSAIEEYDPHEIFERKK